MERSSILILLASCQQTCMTYTTAVCTVNRTPYDGQRNCPKHVEFHSKNKFEKLLHLVGFVIHSFSGLSYDRSKASSKASSPHSAIQSFLFQMTVSSPFLKVIQ